MALLCNLRYHKRWWIYPNRTKGQWYSFLEWKYVNLHKFIGRFYYLWYSIYDGLDLYILNRAGSKQWTYQERLTVSLVRTICKFRMLCVRKDVKSLISHQMEMNVSISRPCNCMGSWISQSLFPVSAHQLTNTVVIFAAVPYWGWCVCVEDCGEQCDVVSPFEHTKTSKHVNSDIPLHLNHRNSSHNNLLVKCCYVLWHWASSVFRLKTM